MTCNESVACRFCAWVAVARFALPQGCACYPDDREQALCVQHVVNAEPIGAMELIEVLDVPQWEWFTQTQQGWP